MDAKQLQEFKNTAPFHPFTIVTAAGTKYHVPHPNFIWIPTDTTAFVISHGIASVIHLPLVASVDVDDVAQKG